MSPLLFGHATSNCHLASICRFLTDTATATLVSAFVLSRIDHVVVVELPQAPEDDPQKL